MADEHSAVLVLLQCYETGRGVQEDKQEAVRLYEAAAEKVQTQTRVLAAWLA